jgi:hypothetical protein
VSTSNYQNEVSTFFTQPLIFDALVRHNERNQGKRPERGGEPERETQIKREKESQVTCNISIPSIILSDNKKRPG